MDINRAGKDDIPAIPFEILFLWCLLDFFSNYAFLTIGYLFHFVALIDRQQLNKRRLVGRNGVFGTTSNRFKPGQSTLPPEFQGAEIFTIHAAQNAVS